MIPCLTPGDAAAPDTVEIDPDSHLAGMLASSAHEAAAIRTRDVTDSRVPVVYFR